MCRLVAVGSAVCACCTDADADHLAEEADEFLHLLLSTLCVSAKSLSCLISPPPTIVLPCFIKRLWALCTHISATVPNCLF